MYDLIRFFKTKEQAEEFVKGRLYLNTLDYFFNHGLQDPKFSYEGAIHPGNIIIDGKQNGDFSLKTETEYRLDAVRYCNVLSMMLHGYDYGKGGVERVPERARELGDYAVIVSNLEVFVKRLFDYLKGKQDLFGLMGPVEYHYRIEPHKDLDLFDRPDAFAWQREWRLVVIRKHKNFDVLLKAHPDLEYEVPEVIEISDLSEIAEVCETKDLTRNITKIYRGYHVVNQVKPDDHAILLRRNGVPIPYDTFADQYVGYTPRSSFLAKILETDRAKVRIL